MNSFLDVRNLYPIQANYSDSIPLEFDEPDYSYLTRLMLLIPSTDRFGIVEKYFGNRHCRVEKPLHAGFGAFANHFSSRDNGSCDDVIDAHSMLAFFKPFADSERYSNACELARSDRGKKITQTVGLRGEGTFREQPVICLNCVNEDLRIKKFAHYRRSHQIVAVSHCSNHHTRLITACAECGKQFSHWDIPDKECHHCGKTLKQVESNSESVPDLGARIRLSQIVASVFSGKIDYVDVNVRLDVLRSRTKQVVKNRSGVTGDNLATHINKMFGRAFLDSLGLRTDTAPTLGWPALLIHGRSLMSDPIANCVLIAALFDSPNHYLDLIKTRQISSERFPTSNKPLKGAGNISFSMMREALRARSLNSFVNPNGKINVNFKKWMGAYPGLSDRRLNFLLQKKLRCYKKCIQEKLEEIPRLSRNQATITLNTEIAYIRKYDLHWLDQHLPARKIPKHIVSTQPKILYEESDAALCKQLEEVVNKKKNGSRRPTRLKSLDLLRLSGLTKFQAEIRCNYPRTLKLVDQLTEDMDKYYRRSLEWASKNLARQFGKCDNIIELFIHAKVGIEYVKLLESYAISLLDREQKHQSLS